MTDPAPLPPMTVGQLVADLLKLPQDAYIMRFGRSARDGSAKVTTWAKPEEKAP